MTGTRVARHALHSPKTSGTRGAVGSRKARGTNAGTGATRGARAVAGAVKAAGGAGGAVAAPETNLALMGQNKTTVIVQGRSGGGGRGEGGGGTTTVRQIENQTTHRTKHENRGKETQGDAAVGTFFGVFFVHPPTPCLLFYDLRAFWIICRVRWRLIRSVWLLSCSCRVFVLLLSRLGLLLGSWKAAV